MAVGADAETWGVFRAAAECPAGERALPLAVGETACS